MNTPVTGLTNSLHDWQKAHEIWQVQLLDIVQPEMGQCVLAIYGGNSDYLLDIYNMFKTLITDKNWTFSERAVWLDKKLDEYYYTEHFNSSKQANDKLVGIELQILGAGATLYFAKEGGKHIWVTREQQKYYYTVFIVQGLIKNFQTPKGVYRKKLLEGLEDRREYWKNGFDDLVNKTTITSSNWLSVLQKQLDENFQKLLSQVLCGEILEIEDFLDKKIFDDDLLDGFFDEDIPF
jgi:hypothetical protein